MTKAEKALKKIKKDLTDQGLTFETGEVDNTIWKSGYTIWTEKCTIEISKTGEVTVNEVRAELADVIWEVLAVERQTNKPA